MDESLKKSMLETFDVLRRNTIEISYEPTEDGAHQTRSKIGGRPSVPKGFQWPYYEGESFENVTENRPLAFLAEIHLSEAAEYDTEGLLPSTGVLSFFYELETQKWGFDPKDMGCSRVYYFEHEEELSEVQFPEELHEDFKLPEFRLSFERNVSLPSYADYPDDEEDFDWDDFNELREAYGCPSEDCDVTRLLGYPDVIQNPMEEQCEIVARGYYDGGGRQVPEELEDEICRASKDWTLLFQMGTVEHGDFELMFGDCGHIYFWIRKQDLAERNFDQAWLILQCY